jgi:hypothetical protein
MNAEQHEWYWRGYNDAKKEDKSEFVGLTDEEINLIYAEPQTHIGQYARAIEAKLKEKNT